MQDTKVTSLYEAISKFVDDGDTLCLGGFTTNRRPYAAIHEILRQGQKDFIGEGGPAGGDWDLLIGEDRVKAYINCYTANSGFSNVLRRFRAKAEDGTLLMEDYSQDVEMLRLHAASLGLPYLPVKLMQGTDLVDKWGISKEEREKIDKLPNDKFFYVTDPFSGDDKVVAVPVPQIDTAIIHAQVCSPDGTTRIIGDEFHDVDIAIAAKKTIVTCEELMSNEDIRREPTKNTIPGMCVDAVVHVPKGAHPSQCYGYYDYDANFLRMYEQVSKTEEGFKAFVQEYIYNFKDHSEYLEKIGLETLLNIMAVQGYGYATDVLKKQAVNEANGEDSDNE